MGKNTKIEWTHRRRADGSYIPGHTFNPVRGCRHAVLENGTPHPGCLHCYAENMSRINPGVLGEWGEEGEGTRKTGSESYWNGPLCWNTDAAEGQERHIVFCASLGDIYENWKGPIMAPGKQPVYLAPNFRASDGKLRATMNDVRSRLYRLIDKTTWLDWLLLTKRPGNILSMWPAAGVEDTGGFTPGGEAIDAPVFYRDNVWLITSVSNQETFDELWPQLARCRDLTPVLGLSAEPLLGPIKLRAFCPYCDKLLIGSLSPTCGTCGSPTVRPDWIIAGGESGDHARPMHPDWPRSLRDQCKQARIAFHFKQWGEWRPMLRSEINPHVGNNATLVSRDERRPIASGCHYMAHQLEAMLEEEPYCWQCPVVRVGKDAAGRLLDGVDHSEFPREATCPAT